MATACAVFPLIIVGAGVTSQDAGMAFPDWPTSNGSIVNPPQWWQSSDTRWEHGHRLIGWIVGMLATALAVVSWRRRGAIRVLGIATFVAIGVQGLLGGLRVTEVSRVLAMVHGVWGQLCFSLAASIALISARAWVNSKTHSDVPASGFLQKLAVVGTAAIFIQLVFGAVYRHFGGSHALIAHLLWAIVVVLIIGWIAMWIIGLPSHFRFLISMGRHLVILMVVQLFLGAAAFFMTRGDKAASGLVAWLIPSAHVAVGALILVCSLFLAIGTRRFLTSDLESSESTDRESLAVS